MATLTDQLGYAAAKMRMMADHCEDKVVPEDWRVNDVVAALRAIVEDLGGGSASSEAAKCDDADCKKKATVHLCDQHFDAISIY
jgi:hypothetical protein